MSFRIAKVPRHDDPSASETPGLSTASPHLRLSDSPAPGQTWIDAETIEATQLSSRFETAWRDSPRCRPDPEDFLPEPPQARQAALLALLRTELGLRWEAGDRVSAETLIARHPELNEQGRVALLYEEYCQHEDAGQPIPVDIFLAQHAQLASGLRRVLDIHDLVGSISLDPTQDDFGSDEDQPDVVEFPVAGQRVGGFYLVEELGRGSFARVFLARERNLADRLVALKVVRGSTHEPQTLARLQHTHIVPIFSCSLDSCGEFLLICMPFFGRVTLAQILATPAAIEAQTGRELLEVLDRLNPAREGGWQRPAVRAVLERKTASQVIAWWGARLAEALDHAHDHGVVHHDLKPSNVLLTGDGRPMLLDFNLAQDRLKLADDPDLAPMVVGGTLDYMAPEQIRRLVEGVLESPGRSPLGLELESQVDIYALGVVLFELLTGRRPFERPKSRPGLSFAEILLRAAELRETISPEVRSEFREIPAGLVAILKRCLDPDPIRRYAEVKHLAADLRAVSCDEPLRYASEPSATRVSRWLRRQGLWIAGWVIAGSALALSGINLWSDQSEQARLAEGIEARLELAEAAIDRRDYPGAMVQLDAAADLLDDPSARARPIWNDLRRQVEHHFEQARRGRDLQLLAVSIQGQLVAQKQAWLGFGGDLQAADSSAIEIVSTLGIWPVRDPLNPGPWLDDSRRALLGDRVADSLVETIDQLTFLWAISLWERGSEQQLALAFELCQRMEGASPRPYTWQRLSDMLQASAALPDPFGPTVPRRFPSWSSIQNDLLPHWVAQPDAETRFRIGLLDLVSGRWNRAQDHLLRSSQLRPEHVWTYLCLSRVESRLGLDQEALRHADLAVALAPQFPWVLWQRARLLEQQGNWLASMRDLIGVVEASRNPVDDVTSIRRSAKVSFIALDVLGQLRYFEVLGRIFRVFSLGF